MRIDLNADVGESYGAWSLGEDEALIPLVTSVNVACGAHAGDPDVIARTVALAVAARCRGRRAPGLSRPRRLRAAGDGAHARRDRAVRRRPGRRGVGSRPGGGRAAAAREDPRRAVQPGGAGRGRGGGDRTGGGLGRSGRCGCSGSPVGAGRRGTRARAAGRRGGVRGSRVRGGRLAPLADAGRDRCSTSRPRPRRRRWRSSAAR